MIEITNVEVMGWEHAIRGMRNPLNSWNKSDSYSTHIEDADTRETAEYEHFVGDNDLDLMKKLVVAGTDHRKFMRMITVYADINAPLYWWKEYDTYKVGTVANSCSTMHKIHQKCIADDLFSFDNNDNNMRVLTKNQKNIVSAYMGMLEELRQECSSGDETWRKLIQLLPCGFNQKRTVMLNYEVLHNMYRARKNHKLTEWRTFCEWIKSLPYSELITQGA